MKRNLSLFIILVLVMGSRAGEEFRVFAAADGRTIDARILEYNPSRNKLRIERRGKGTLWIGPEVFAESDRKYIEEWIAASLFLAEKNLTVSIKKVKIGSSGSKKSLKETDRYSYEVKLQNRSKQMLNISNVEYCYYIRKIKTGGGRDIERSDGGQLKVGVLKPAQAKVVSPPTFSLFTIYRSYTESYFDNYGGTQTDTSIVKVSEDKLRGIWIRIYGPEVDGRPLVRDVTYPKNLIEKVEWGKVEWGTGER